MVRTGLDFAPNTSADCKRLVGTLHKPEDILAAYRAGRERFGTGDLVLAVSDQVGHIEYMPRLTYCEHLKRVFGDKALGFALWSSSAHRLMKLPSDSEAWWFVVDVRGMDLPVMCVLYATQMHVDPVESVLVH